MTVVGHPCDLIKTRVQHSPGTYRSAYDCVVRVISVESPIGLFRGMSPPLAMTGVMNASLFGFNGISKRFVASMTRKDLRELNLAEIVMAAEFCVPFYAAVVTPVERLKVVLITDRSDSMSSFIRRVGVGGLWRGYSVIVLMRCLGLPAYLGSYELCKTNMSKLSSSPSSNVLSFMLSGALAGFAFWGITFPVDFLKTRVQAAGSQASPIDIVSDVYWKEGGIRGFYRGVGPCLARAGPANALCFATVEITKDWLGR